MRLGLLSPRYGEEVVGGTEHWLRSLCEHLAGTRGWTVEVFTTCARSAETWADEYPPGSVELNGVTVRRYQSVSGRDPAYLHTYPRLQRDPRVLSRSDAEDYVRLVGPVCPAAVDAAVGSDCDLVAVTPYLYWPAVRAVPRLGRRCLFHGAAHDEPELYFPMMPALFEAVGGFAFNSFAERDLVEHNFPVGHLPSAVIGNAVNEGRGDPAAARREVGLGPDEPFALCLGRVERSKGTTALSEMWGLYRRRRPDAPRLVVLGPVHDPPAGSDGVVLAGRRTEAVKWGLLEACSFLVAPSAQESFSLVVIEAWLAGRPVLVNGRCGPTVEHCRRSGGGVWFHEYGDLEVAVDRLFGDTAMRDRLGRIGEGYARRQFGWEAVLDRYEDLADRVRRRAGTAGRAA